MIILPFKMPYGQVYQEYNPHPLKELTHIKRYLRSILNYRIKTLEPNHVSIVHTKNLLAYFENASKELGHLTA